MKFKNEKIIMFNDDKISFNFIDNNSDVTFFCIHGINSSKDFIGTLDKCTKDYNIFSFSYGDLKNLAISNFIALTKYIINKYFQTEKLIVISHSLGSYITLKLFDNKNIIKYIFINPLHPLTFEYKPFLKTLEFAQQNSERSKDGASFEQSKKFYSDAVERRTKWYKVLLEIYQNIDLMQEDLKSLLNVKDKSTFIRSSGDFIISGVLLEKFLLKNKIKSKIIKYTGHSPLIKETKRTYDLFEL